MILSLAETKSSQSVANDVLKGQEVDFSIYREIKNNNLHHLDDTALIFLGKKITYGALLEQADLVADILASLGLKKGDMILTCVNGTPQTVSLLLACSKMGILAMMLTPKTTEEQFNHAVYDMNIRFLFCMTAFYSIYAGFKAIDDMERVVIMPVDKSIGEDVGKKEACSDASNFMRWSEFIALIPNEKAEEVVGGSYPFIACSTTGSTGTPKFIVHVNSSYVVLEKIYQKIWPAWKRGSLLFSIVPTFVAVGISMVLLTPLALGMTIIQEPRLNPFETFIFNLVEFRPNIVLATKSIWCSMAETLSDKNFDLSSIQHALTVGEVVSRQEYESMNNFLSKNGSPAKAENLYGMSECNTAITHRKKEEKSHTSAGFPVPGVVMKAFNYDTHEECQLGEIGEIFFKAPSVMKEYLYDPVSTAEFFIKDNHGDTWGRTNDIGYILDSGEVYICCRAKERFIDKNGKSIFPFLIERVIGTDPNIKRIKIVKTMLDGNPVLAVHFTTKEPIADLNSYVDHLHKLCQEDKSLNIIPTLYKLRDFIPINSAGKVDMLAMSAETDGFVIKK